MSLNVRRFYLLSFFSGFIFTYTLQTIFLLSRGITPAELALFASISAIVGTLMEIPTGFIADKFGRKYSVALSYFLNALVFLLITFVHGFGLLALIAVLKGTSNALESGAFESLMYEEIQAEGQEDSYLKLTTKGSNVAIAVGVFATFLGPILYSYYHTVPFLLSFVVYLVMTLVVLTFREKSVSHEVQENVKIFDGVKAVLKIRPILLIMLIDLLLLLFVNVYYQVAFFPKLENLGLDVRFFGVVDTVTLGITSLLLFILPRLALKSDKLKLAFFTSLVAVLFVLFGASKLLIPTMIFGVLFDPAWNMRRHIIPTITNKYFTNHNRALSISSMSFVSNLGAALLVPIFTVLFTRNYLYSLLPLAGVFILLLLFISKPVKVLNK